MSVGKGTYYLGRVIKLGQLTPDSLIEALKSPASIIRRGVGWIFIDINEVNERGRHFVYGRLCKYSPDAQVIKIDPDRGAQFVQQEPNLLIAASPFVYIPEHSGIVFLEVPNHIERHIFATRFREIVKEAHNNFFVDCVMEMVADLQTFSTKLLRLDGIHRISANIWPPNPLFSPLWSSLKEYLLMRNTDRMRIEEENTDGQPLKTQLSKHVEEVLGQKPDSSGKPTDVQIGDAAILMAADGYGDGMIEGKVGGRVVVIKTSENTRSFRFDRDPDPWELYEAANRIFLEIAQERHMKH